MSVILGCGIARAAAVQNGARAVSAGGSRADGLSFTSPGRVSAFGLYPDSVSVQDFISICLSRQLLPPSHWEKGAWPHSCQVG